MVQFNVGDRVKYSVQTNYGMLDFGAEYTVQRVNGTFLKFVGYEYDMYMEKHFELVAPAVVDGREEHTFYCVVYKGIGGNTFMNSLFDQQSAESFADTVRGMAGPYKVLGLKKIKVKV